MATIYRAMTNQDGKPKIGPTRRTLGVKARPGDGSELVDIPTDSHGIVRPNTGGMSVAPSWRDLPRHRIPARLQCLLPSACGKNEDACWRMGDGPFQDAAVASGLRLRVTSRFHGLVEPAMAVSLDQYRSDLAATQDEWVIDEK
jgi:hypothetical protein